MQAGLAQRAEHSPRKREAGGSSPPASTRGTRGETVDAAASEAAAATAWRFKSFRVHHLQHVIILRFDRTRLRTGLQLRGSLCKTRSWSLCAVPLRSQSPPYSALGSFSRARRMPTSMATTRLLRPCSAQRTCLRLGTGSPRLGSLAPCDLSACQSLETPRRYAAGAEDGTRSAASSDARLKAAVLARDGYRCRYCGIPVIDASIRKIARELYPHAVPWKDNDEREQHAAFQCFWLQYDHVVPHSHGGSSSEDNIVVTCALCNYGKDGYTLRQLGISDPRLRPPEPVSWDGLERLRVCTPTRPAPRKAPYVALETAARAPTPTPNPARSSAFFLPEAWISSGYLNTPPIDGKQRWFKLGPEVIAEPAVRNGVGGCRLFCDPAQFQRRRLSPEAFLDPEDLSLKIAAAPRASSEP